MRRQVQLYADFTTSAVRRAEESGLSRNPCGFVRKDFRNPIATTLSGWQPFANPVTLLFVITWLFLGCDQTVEHQEDTVSRRVKIAVTSYPLLAMAEEMAGDAADVELVVSRSTTSPDWKPDSDAVRRMQQATRILISGADYEPWLQRVTVPRSRLIDTSQGFYDQFVRIPDAVIHQHGPDGDHSHPGVVWATWLDPQLATSQLYQTSDVLLSVLPDSQANIRKVADRLAEDFRRLDDRLEELATVTSDTAVTVVGDAPVYQYLTKRLGWNLKYIHLPSTGLLSDEDHASIQTAIAEYEPTVVFLRSTLATLRDDLNGQSLVPVVLVDLCEHADGQQTLIQRMNQNLTAIIRAVSLQDGQNSVRNCVEWGSRPEGA
ncbi:MAG: metal ABC transporter substrate-binding protein [Fuerstiella sp.]|nr:metal ABC transporter substrate-binding protein [Fuerstiella sp.]